MQQFINEVAEIALKKSSRLKELSAQNLEHEVDYAVLQQEIQDAKYLINAIIDGDQEKFRNCFRFTTSKSIHESIAKHVQNIEKEFNGTKRVRRSTEKGLLALQEMNLSNREVKQ